MVRGQWGNLARMQELHWIFNDHRESGPLFNVSSEAQCLVSPSLQWGVRTHIDCTASLTPLPTAT